MEFTKTKAAILFLILALNLCGYLWSSRKNSLNLPFTRAFSDNPSIKSFVKDMTANKTGFISRMREGEFHPEGKLLEEETYRVGKKSNKSKKLSKHEGKKFVTHQEASLVSEEKNAEAMKHQPVKEDEKEDSFHEIEMKNGSLTTEKKKTANEGQKKAASPTRVKKKKKVHDKMEQELEGEKASKIGNLVNPHDFNYVINEPNKCKNEDGSDKDVFLLVLISSVHANFKSRKAIRGSWGSPTNINGHEVMTLFLLAKKNNDTLQKLVLKESKKYCDIIMEDFVDTYKNLTLKTIMGMKWMATFCAHAKFMMKTDDDMYVSYANIINYLDKSPKTNFATGYVIRSGPIRDPRSKWYMPKSKYPHSKYPPFCSGTGYILSGDVPPKIYSTSLSTPYLYLEDVYVAICLEKLHIVPKHHREFHNWRTKYTLCHFRRILTAHMVKPTEMTLYWKDQTTNKSTC